MNRNTDMKTLEQLYNGFYLGKESANSQISNWTTPLWIAPLKKLDNYEKLEIDREHFAFAEKNENWKIEYFHGLKNFLWIQESDSSPIFIFDNHNHAIVFRYNIIYSQNTNDAKLIHIDQHSDCWENKNHLELNRKENELEKVFRFWNQKCNVWNFIPPALESWIITEQRQIRSVTALENLEINKNQNFILDIDLDFCLSGIDRDRLDNQAIKELKNKFDELSKHTLCTTIATSPYFLNQEKAISIVEMLLS